MKEAQDARFEWLNNRNPELVSECHWRIKRLIDDSVFYPRQTHTEKFEVTFNSEAEQEVLRKYLKGKGYTFDIEPLIKEEYTAAKRFTLVIEL
jgi:hypothetical protein